jgi:hypothetical protein
MTQHSDRKAKSARVRAQKTKRTTPKAAGDTKKAKCLKLLARRQGADIAELQDAVGWQAHSVRGFLSATVRKLGGYQLETITADGKPRRYRLTKAASNS